VVDFCHLRHARGQRQVIWRIFEQRILRNGYFMEKDVGLLGIQADRLLIRDEMHFMATLRQFDPELRAHNPATAIRGITSDAYFHLIMSLRSKPLPQHSSPLNLSSPLAARSAATGLAGCNKNYVAPLQTASTAFVAVKSLQPFSGPLG